MYTKKNHFQYLQVIHHSMFLQVLKKTGPDGGLDGVLFDARHKDMPMDDSVNATLLLFEVLLLKIPCVRHIVNTSRLAFCWFDAHRAIVVFDKTKR